MRLGCALEPLPPLVRDYVAAAPVCRIATVRASGDPHIIPVCPVFDGDSTLYVDLAEAGVSARAIANNASVAVLIDDYFDDWSKLTAVVLRCTAEPVSDEELACAWELFRAKFPQGKEIGWSARLTLALRIKSWTEWGLVRPLGYDPE